MNDKCVVLNAKKMNFDGKLDFSILSSDVAVYDDTTEQQLSERIQGVYHCNKGNVCECRNDTEIPEICQTDLRGRYRI